MARGKRRLHEASLKARVLERCAEPGASVASVAMEHGLNANLVHRWRRIAEGRERARASSTLVESFVPLPIAAASMPAAPESIRIELRRGAVCASVEWPLSAASQCAAWLRELMR